MIDHWVEVGHIQKVGVKIEIIMAPTAPVSNKVNKGLSEVEIFRVTIK